VPPQLRIAFLTHEPFYPPSGGGSAAAVFLVQEMVRRGHEVHVFGPQIADAATVAKKFGVTLHPFEKWEMGRYAKFRNFKYLAYPFFLKRLVAAAARETKFDLLFSQHAISAVAAGKLKRQLGVPVVMNFPDLLTGFMETWPSFVAPKPLVRALMRYEISLPVRYGVDGVCAISDEFANRLAARGYPRENICPIYYGYDGALFQPTFQTSPTPLVVMHGSLDHHHINEFGASVLAQVFQKRPDTKFRFVGKRTAALRRTLEMLKGRIPDTAIECTDFVPYADVAKKIHDAMVGIVPYATSTGAQCTMVAKTVEYAAMGVPMVCTPLRGTMRYWGNNPIIRFSEMNPASFAEKVLGWFDETPANRRAWGEAASAKVRTELDWQPFSARVVQRLEEINYARRDGF